MFGGPFFSGRSNTNEVYLYTSHRATWLLSKSSVVSKVKRPKAKGHEATNKDAEEDRHDVSWLPHLPCRRVELIIVLQGHTEPKGQGIAQEDHLFLASDSERRNQQIQKVGDFTGPKASIFFR